MKAVMRSRAAVVSLVAAGILAVGVNGSWRISAAQRSDLAAAPAAGKPLPVGPVATGDRGTTYHWLESRATRVTTRFDDVVAIAERGSDGRLRSRLTDLAGNELAAFAVDPTNDGDDALQFSASGAAAPIRFARRASLKPTLDWTNHQAYTLLRDARSGSSRVDWQGAFAHTTGTAARDVAAAALEVRTEYDSGFASVAMRRRGPRRHAFTGQPVSSDVLVSRLTRDGVQVGTSEWYAEEQAFVWSFPGLTEGYLTPAHLKGIGGAWPFVPDLEWLNTQNLAFHHFHSLVKSKGFVASRGQPSIADKIVNWFVPTLHANEPGCDNLHYLDNTVYRPCCDLHDGCYATYGCGSNTWWEWWSSWRCDVCNAAAFFCFLGGGISDVYYRTACC